MTFARCTRRELCLTVFTLLFVLVPVASRLSAAESKIESAVNTSGFGATSADQELIEKLDQADAISCGEVIKLKYVLSKDMAQLLISWANGKYNPSKAPSTPSDNFTFSATLTVSSDERNNSLVVIGTADDLQFIHKLIEEVDSVGIRAS